MYDFMCMSIEEGFFWIHCILFRNRPSLRFFFRIREPKRKKSPIEEAWEKYGSFGLTSVEQETHEKYFYGTEHWNYFTNDEDLGPVILSLKQETINGRDQFRYLHCVVYLWAGVVFEKTAWTLFVCDNILKVNTRIYYFAFSF